MNLGICIPCHWILAKWQAGARNAYTQIHMINCGFSEAELEMLGKPFTSWSHITRRYSTWVYCHDHGTTCLDERPIRKFDQRYEPHFREIYTLNCKLSHRAPMHWPKRNNPQPMTFGTGSHGFHSFCVLLLGVLTVWAFTGLTIKSCLICASRARRYTAYEPILNIKGGGNVYCSTWLREDKVCMVTRRMWGDVGQRVKCCSYVGWVSLES